ncbi:MAG: AAA family ATPase [Candidatus Aenigmatarchaeota archaeon]
MKVTERIYGLRCSIKKFKSIAKNYLKTFSAPEANAIFLWGPVGIGKTSAVRQLAEELGISWIDLRLASCDIIDLRGPFLVKGEKAGWYRPNNLPDSGKGILFLDEFNLANEEVLKASQQLVLDRVIGEHKLGDNWYIFAAGNRREDVPYVAELSEAIISRFNHFEIQFSFDEFVEYAIEKGFDPRILAFNKFKPSFTSIPNRNTINFPCPRTWEFCSKLLKAGIAPYEAAAISVGPATAAEFEGFLKVYNELPNIEKILDGKEFPEIDKLDVLSAVCTTIVIRAEKPAHYKAILDYALFLAKESKKEFGAFLIRMLFAKIKEQIATLPNWEKIVEVYYDPFMGD